MISEIGQVLASFWRLFTELQVPGLGISFSVLWLGVFAVGFSMMILRPILGISESAAKGNHKIRRPKRETTQNIDHMYITVNRKD